MTAEIRPYHPHDYADCRALWVELTKHHRDIYRAPSIGGDDPGGDFDEFLDNSNLAKSWVALDEGTIVGLTGLIIDGTQGEVEPVIVTDGRRRSGVGRLLVETVIAEAKERGLSHLNIRPVARNTSAIAAFHAYGFRTLGHTEMFIDLRQNGGDWVEGIDLHGLSFEY